MPWLDLIQLAGLLIVILQIRRLNGRLDQSARELKALHIDWKLGQRVRIIPEGDGDVIPISHQDLMFLAATKRATK